MNVLFSGGDNWYPAIIGSKAVTTKHSKLILCVQVEDMITMFVVTNLD